MTVSDGVQVEQRTDAKGGSDVVARSIVVSAPPEAVFEVLVQPARHADFDGSGSVKGRLRGAERLSPGASFGMRMRIGLPYTIKNTVIAYEENRTLAWRHLGHHVWRYDLEPVQLSDGRPGTKVVESFDWSTSRIGKGLEVAGMTRGNATSIEKTLPKLKALVERETRAS